MRSTVCLAPVLWLAAAASAQDPAAAARAAMEAAAVVQHRAVAAQDGAGAALALSAARQREAVAAQERAARPWPWRSETPPAAAPACDPLPEAEADALAADAAAREGLPPALVRAVMERESGFRPCAVSPEGALGLMQLMPATAADLGVLNVFDPAENVASGARFLASLLARYGGNVELALGAYNAGPSRVDAAGGVPDIPETQNYVGAILGRAVAPLTMPEIAAPR